MKEEDYMKVGHIPPRYVIEVTDAHNQEAADSKVEQTGCCVTFEAVQ